MKTEAKYYELYGEVVKSNVFLKRLVIVLIMVNIILAYLSYLGFTRPAQTYVVKDGYAYATEAIDDKRSVHEVRRFAIEFAKHFLEYNRYTFNERFKAAMKMCTSELEYFMHEAVTNSEIPRIVERTTEPIRFEIAEVTVKDGDPFEVEVRGEQIFPKMSKIPIHFQLSIIAVPRTEENPFGLRIINYIQKNR